MSIAQNVNIMVDSGPNASPAMQRVFPTEKGPVTIGNHCWIGASAIIMPNVKLGEFCIVAANSYVNKSFPGILNNWRNSGQTYQIFYRRRKINYVRCMIKFLDIQKITDSFEPELSSAVNRVVKSGWFLLGEELSIF